MEWYCTGGGCRGYLACILMAIIVAAKSCPRYPKQRFIASQERQVQCPPLLHGNIIIVGFLGIRPLIAEEVG